MLIARAAIAFLALPTMVAGVIPALIVRGTAPAQGTGWFGSALIGAGCGILGWCVRDFFASGRGTLAPWDPPVHLVIVGLCRLVRNPMDIAVLATVAGWSVLYLSPCLALYAAFLAVAFHVRVIAHEKPWLSRRFGPEWSAYAVSTRRWLPRWPRAGN
jgi:protein-S-isoprenylcysteine O-methyltransferase Ste14